MFPTEEYFEFDTMYNRQNDRAYVAFRQNTNEHKGIRLDAKFPKRIIVWFAPVKKWSFNFNYF